MLKSVFRFLFRVPKVPFLFPPQNYQKCAFLAILGVAPLYQIFSFQHQCHTSHWGSLLQNQCNSGPWNLILYYAIPYTTGQYHNFTGQCRLSDAIHLPLFITFTFSSSAQLQLSWSHHVSAPADLLFPISTFLGNFYKIIFIVSTNTLWNYISQ